MILFKHPDVAIPEIPWLPFTWTKAKPTLCMLFNFCHLQSEGFDWNSRWEHCQALSAPSHPRDHRDCREFLVKGHRHRAAVTKQRSCPAALLGQVAVVECKVEPALPAVYVQEFPTLKGLSLGQLPSNSFPESSRSWGAGCDALSDQQFWGPLITLSLAKMWDLSYVDLGERERNITIYFFASPASIGLIQLLF